MYIESTPFWDNLTRGDDEVSISNWHVMNKIVFIAHYISTEFFYDKLKIN